MKFLEQLSGEPYQDQQCFAGHFRRHGLSEMRLRDLGRYSMIERDGQNLSVFMLWCKQYNSLENTDEDQN